MLPPVVLPPVVLLPGLQPLLGGQGHVRLAARQLHDVALHSRRVEQADHPCEAPLALLGQLQPPAVLPAGRQQCLGQQRAVPGLGLPAHQSVPQGEGHLRAEGLLQTDPKGCAEVAVVDASEVKGNACHLPHGSRAALGGWGIGAGGESGDDMLQE